MRMPIDSADSAGSSTARSAHASPVGRRSVLAAAAGAGAALALGAGAGPARAATAGATAAPGARPVKLALTARPAAEAERLRLGQALRGSEFQPTGLYVPAGAPSPSPSSRTTVCCPPCGSAPGTTTARSPSRAAIH